MAARLRSYPKVYTLGHVALGEMMNEPDLLVEITEKVDGSQFSFGLLEGRLAFRSSGQEIFPESAGKLFEPAVEQVLSVRERLADGWSYRGEAFFRPKHNTLAYQRAPRGHIMLFGVDRGYQDWADAAVRAAAAEELGMEAVPVLHRGPLPSLEELRGMLDRESALGGVKIEGIVIKQVSNTFFDKGGKALMAKLVSEEFAETHRREWRKTNPSQKEGLAELAESYRTEARWRKAVQHLSERGDLEGEPRDIGPLIVEVRRDFLEEEADNVKEKLWRMFKDQLLRKVTAGLPEWYKKTLAEAQLPAAPPEKATD